MEKCNPPARPQPDDDSSLIDPTSDPALTRIRSDPNLTDKQKELLETQHLRSLKLDRLRKRYARIADWDPIVKRIEAVEKMSDNKLRVFVHFESGDKMAFESVVVHHRCPLKLLAFYEGNLRFKRREGGEGANNMEVGESEVAPLEGEEGEKELEEYRRVNGEGNEVNEGEGVNGTQNGEAADYVPAVNGTGEAEAIDVDAPTAAATAKRKRSQWQPRHWSSTAKTCPPISKLQRPQHPVQQVERNRCCGSDRCCTLN